MTDLQSVVAAAGDQADHHATAPALLLQLQARLGALAHSADVATAAGRRPFRTPPEWRGRLTDLAYVLFLLADQTGVALEEEVRRLAAHLSTPSVG